MNKEQIYDEQIAPLMAKANAIAMANRMSFIAVCYTPNDTEPHLLAVTVNLLADGSAGDRVCQNIHDFVRGIEVP